MVISVGDIDLGGQVVLAPMSGVTDLAFDAVWPHAARRWWFLKWWQARNWCAVAAMFFCAPKVAGYHLYLATGRTRSAMDGTRR